MQFINGIITYIVGKIKDLLNTIARSILYCVFFILFISLLSGGQKPQQFQENLLYKLPIIQIMGFMRMLDADEILFLETTIEYAFIKASNLGIDTVFIIMDSPGGAIITAREIYDCLLKCKQKYNKDVVVLVPRLSASGGTYVSAAADVIIASPNAILGSIGVYSEAMTVYFGEFLEKVGIEGKLVYTPKRSVYKAHDPLENAKTSANKEMLAKKYQDDVERMYLEFIDVVLRRIDRAKSEEHIELIHELGGSAYPLCDKKTAFQSLGLYDEIQTISEMIEYLDDNLEGFKEIGNLRQLVFKQDNKMNILRQPQQTNGGLFGAFKRNGGILVLCEEYSYLCQKQIDIKEITLPKKFPF